MTLTSPSRSNFKDLYEKLFSSIKSQKCKSSKHHTAAMYLTGEQYFEQSNKQKILVIGRALNGWQLDCDFKLSCIENSSDLAEKFIAEWDKMDDPTANVSWSERNLSHSECHHLKWVNTSIRGKKTSSNSFWRLAKIATEKVFGCENESWIDCIAWTNLYKVSPDETGNPQGRCKVAQEEICIDILEKEIDDLNPSHIFVIAMTNKKDGSITDEWVKPFIRVFENAEKKNRTVVFFSRPEFKSSKDLYSPYIYNYETKSIEKLKE